MKSKYIIYPSVILLAIVVPALRYYASTPGTNACVLEYVDELDESNYKGYMYDIDGVKHIEPANSNMAESLEQYKIGEANGCLMASNNLLSDLNNTLYCTISYLIKKAPVHDKLKEPLKILERE